MKKKAFTLTELLVVVVIIGVLSAVVLPKFTKVLETRKTTEAEEMMTAVRNEQEARCTISKNYKKDISQLASYQAGKNFDYADLDGVGMIATAKSGKYSLRMPSYADGRICCDDEYCQEELNKNYPRCNELENFVEGNADCSVPGPGIDEEPEPEPDPDPDPKTGCDETAHTAGSTTTTDAQGCTITTTWTLNPYPTCWTKKEEKDCPDGCTPGKTETQTCNFCGKKTHTCKDDGTWGEWSECSVQNKLDCFKVIRDCDPNLKPSDTQSCGCEGTQQRKVVCVIPPGEDETPYWKTGVWGNCQEPPGVSCEEICENTPVEKRECTPGERKYDATNMCVFTTTTQMSEKKMMEEVENITTVPVEDENEGPNENTPDRERTRSNYYVVSVDYGYICNDACQWVKNSCPVRHGGGSGGGGHGGGGGGSAFSLEAVEAQGSGGSVGGGSFECCTSRVSGNGIWATMHLGSCETMSSIDACLASLGM